LFPYMREVSDCAGARRISRYRHDGCSLPPTSTTSAPRSTQRFPVGAYISQLNTRPARTSVNASPSSSRTTAHDSRPNWVANPFLYDSFIHYNSPVLTGAWRLYEDRSWAAADRIHSGGSDRK
jgi:hypothetical protein